MDIINRWGVDVIIWLQRMPIFIDHPFASIWLIMTKLGDPATIFTLHAPLLFVFLNDSSVFIRFFLASCISEFLNGVFKWMLFADRPYWWIHTSGISMSEDIQLKQFPPTCETGPGSPSGHCMITAAAWMVIILSQRSKLSRLTSWMAYMIFLILLALSRLYIATHFPHQVLLGAIVGAIVGMSCNRIKSTSFDLRYALKLILGLLVTALATYKTIVWLNYDPNWSIALAQRYCENKNWIHLTTTPFGSVFRDIGALLGLAVVAQFTMALSRRKYKQANLGTRLVGLILNLIVAKVMIDLPLINFGDTLTVFYSCVFVKHALLVLCYTVIIPKLLGMFKL